MDIALIICGGFVYIFAAFVFALLAHHELEDSSFWDKDLAALLMFVGFPVVLPCVVLYRLARHTVNRIVGSDLPKAIVKTEGDVVGPDCSLACSVCKSKR